MYTCLLAKESYGNIYDFLGEKEYNNFLCRHKSKCILLEEMLVGTDPNTWLALWYSKDCKDFSGGNWTENVMGCN